MNLLILGASGPTGRQLVAQALEQGHLVKAIVRDPARLPVKHGRLLVRVADIFDEAALTAEIRGQDVVLSALGSGQKLKSTVISSAVPVLIRAMDSAAVKRLIFLSSFGSGDTRKDAPLLTRIVIELILNKILLDKTKGDQMIRASGLDYTLVYPPRLINGNRTGKYRVGEKLRLPQIAKISRADVADFMLSQLSADSYIRKTVIISY